MSDSKEKQASPPSSIDETSNNRQQQTNPNDFAERRRRALAEIDNAEFSWFHAKVALIAGVGFFTDASVFPFFFFFSSLSTNCLKSPTLVTTSSPLTSPLS